VVDSVAFVRAVEYASSRCPASYSMRSMRRSVACWSSAMRGTSSRVCERSSESVPGDSSGVVSGLSSSDGSPGVVVSGCASGVGVARGFGGLVCLGVGGVVVVAVLGLLFPDLPHWNLLFGLRRGLLVAPLVGVLTVRGCGCGADGDEGEEDDDDDEGACGVAGAEADGDADDDDDDGDDGDDDGGDDDDDGDDGDFVAGPARVSAEGVVLARCRRRVVWIVVWKMPLRLICRSSEKVVECSVTVHVP
jgi:hypothetical protein